MNYKLDKSNNMINVLSERISEEFVPFLENITINESSDAGLTSSEKKFYNKELKSLNYEMHDWESKYNKLCENVRCLIVDRFRKGVFGVVWLWIRKKHLTLIKDCIQ